MKEKTEASVSDMFDLDFLAQFVVYHWLFMVLSGAEDSGSSERSGG